MPHGTAEAEKTVLGKVPQKHPLPTAPQKPTRLLRTVVNPTWASFSLSLA